MDHRLYFILGDLFANLLTGAAVGLLCWLIVDTGWNMWIAMFLMMTMGMLVAIVLWVPFSILFGAMEVMVPLMLTGMVAGMVVGMSLTVQQLTAMRCLADGALYGLISLVAIWILNSVLRGTQAVRWR